MKDWQRLAAAFIFYLLNITVLQGTLKTTLTLLGFGIEWYYVVTLAVLLTLAFLRLISPVWGLQDALALGVLAGVYLIAIYNNPTQVIADLLRSAFWIRNCGYFHGSCSKTSEVIGNGGCWNRQCNYQWNAELGGNSSLPNPWSGFRNSELRQPEQGTQTYLRHFSGICVYERAFVV
ncbi:conserved membrane hypothetical protein [Thermococcus barophilus]|uniref:Uncharacterized protein n=1 Tax=Thermococcus barophilus TaxID=55802 RepID=A0A0S1XAQ5_THEBA|nr:conserved membrane hypothetical protein [Thermococcus barophilus]